jgi:hypothetical protein
VEPQEAQPEGKHTSATEKWRRRTVVSEATERSSGKICPPPLRRCRQLRGRVTVDVLVDPASVPAEIAAPKAERTLLRLDRIERPALEDVGRRGVLVLRRLTGIRHLDGVAPVGPNAIGEAPERRHVEVVARERQGDRRSKPAETDDVSAIPKHGY